MRMSGETGFRFRMWAISTHRPGPTGTIGACRAEINLFTRNVYAYGVLGRFIGCCAWSRLHGKNPRRMLTARNMEEQRWLFENTIGPVFGPKLVRALCKLPVSCYGLGIPPRNTKRWQECRRDMPA